MRQPLRKIFVFYYLTAQWLNTLALDAPLIACLWQRYLLKKHAISGHWLESILLFLAVWAIYIIDRLIDVSYLQNITLSSRHSFYQSYQTPALIGLGILIMIGIRLSIYLPLTTLILGTGVMITCGWYLARTHTDNIIPKEARSSILFASGISLVIWLAQPSITLLLDSIILAMLAFTNIGLISVADHTMDTQQGQLSLSLRYDRWSTFWTSYSIALLIYVLITQRWMEATIVMIHLIVYIQWRTGKLKSNDVHTLTDTTLGFAPLIALIM